ECLRRAVLQIRLRAVKYGPRHEDLVGLGDRLGPGCGVDYGADRRQVTMGVPEFAKAEFTGVNADADPELAGGKAMGCDQSLAPFAPVFLNVARCPHGVPGGSARTL